MEKREAPRRAGDATGAGKPCHATAAGTRKIARRKAKGQHGAAYTVTPDLGGDPFDIYVSGRNAWALDRLREAGPKGVTPFTEPAPRWSAYVHNLRGLGVPIETLTEPHGGAFSGTHARYVLRATARKGGADD